MCMQQHLQKWLLGDINLRHPLKSHCGGVALISFLIQQNIVGFNTASSPSIFVFYFIFPGWQAEEGRNTLRKDVASEM